MQLELTALEEHELKTLLDRSLGDFSMEIADTDNPGFRRDLQERRAVLQDLRAKLEPADDWLVDEQGRESFPASDAPAH